MSPLKTKNPWVKTPLIESTTLSKAAGWLVATNILGQTEEVTQEQQNISQA